MRFDDRLERVGHDAALLADPPLDRVGRTFADDAARGVDARHAGLRGERHELRVVGLAVLQPELIPGEHHDRTAFGRLVGQARELRGLGQRRSLDARYRQELDGFAVADRDRARLVEQQRRAVARRFDGTAAHREHVALHQPVHARDADRGEQRADGRRDEAHEQPDEHDDRLRGGGVDRERLERDDRHHEDERQAREQDVERDLVGGLLPLGALDERDHAVEERLAGLRRDVHDDLVGQHAGAAGHRAAVPSRLADHGRRLAGDRRLVDRRDALHDVAVAGNQLAGPDDAEVADLQLARGRLGDAPVGLPNVRDRLGAGLAQRVGLRLAPPFGHRLGEVREQHREPQERRDEPREPVASPRRRG